MSSQNVWELIRNGDIDARNEIWEKHQSAVDYIAMRMAAKLPRHVSVDDLKISRTVRAAGRHRQV